MQKIRVLSDLEIQCIAAGEVIENPSSILKELVENSIDAEATEIKIIFKEGGVKEITIIDNGCGMSYEDLQLALLPHATSKLLNIDSLYYNNNIYFGFRGEALSAISGVSNISIISRTKNALYGYRIFSDHGKIASIEKESSNFGTTISVKNLFEKVPARKKYLASLKNQEKNMVYVILGLALSHPKISFLIYKDDKLYKEYQAVKDFLSRAYQLVAQDEECYIPIEYEDMYIKLEGLISLSEYGYYDRSRIFILANNRLIKQYRMSQSCIKAYRSENFLKKYPELFVSITVPPDQIDVNVHPRKEEVLFLYQKKIEQLLTEILIKALEKRTKKIFSQSIVPIKSVVSPFIKNDFYEKKENQKEYQKIDKKKEIESIGIENNTSILKTNHVNLNQAQKNYYIDNEISNSEHEIVRETIDRSEFIADKEELFISNNSIQVSLFENNSEKKFIGVLAKTYILFLSNNSILCIDQHALHEKILYEQYIKHFKDNKCILKQPLLFYEKIHINLNQKELFEHEMAVFNSLGIYYTIENDLLLVTDYPSIFLKSAISILLISYFIILENNKEKTFEEKQNLVLHEMAALYGCKNAIKAGDSMDEKEIFLLCEAARNNDFATFCPHGRPIYYEITVKQLEVLFKRK